MNKFKSHFRYTKNQRNGIFLLLFSALIVQFIVRFVDFQQNELQITVVKNEEFQRELDSLIALKRTENEQKQYKFNPNYLTDYSAYVLGLSESELLRISRFREQGKYIYAIKEFQEVSQISDSLVEAIEGRLNFPERRNISTTKYKKALLKPKKLGDLNEAKATDFQEVYGVGKVLSKRIVSYRKLLGGFTFEDQIFEVWGLEKEIATKLLEQFKIFETPEINKININTATFKALYKLPYIDYELTKKIVEYREEVAEIQSIEELKKIDGFPLEKFDRIALYLGAK